MAVIEVIQTGDVVVLRNQHSIGRNPNNISVVQENDVSRKHAIIHWESRNWVLTDFSSNGTKVNNVLVHRSSQKLKRNDVIQFSKNKSSKWKLVKVNAPCSFLRAIEGKEIIDLESGLMFPDERQQSTLFRDKVQNWILDDGKTETVLQSGNTYTINNKEYIFIENESQTETRLNIDLTLNAWVHLFISNDEESVNAQIKVNGLVIDLGSRAYNHLLLYLARMRKDDQEKGLSIKLSGWVYIDQIIYALGKEMLRDVDEYYINNLICRLRKKLLDSPPCGHLFANIVERKKGKLRFGLANVKIEKEHMLA